MGSTKHARLDTRLRSTAACTPHTCTAIHGCRRIRLWRRPCRLRTAVTGSRCETCTGYRADVSLQPLPAGQVVRRQFFHVRDHPRVHRRVRDGDAARLRAVHDQPDGRPLDRNARGERCEINPSHHQWRVVEVRTSSCHRTPRREAAGLQHLRTAHLWLLRLVTAPWLHAGIIHLVMNVRYMVQACLVGRDAALRSYAMTSSQWHMRALACCSSPCSGAKARTWRKILAVRAVSQCQRFQHHVRLSPDTRGIVSAG